MSTGATHVSWGSIELLHNCVRTLTLLAEQGQPYPVVEYRAKVKLHGTNCAVQITADGFVAQSRNLLLTPEADHKGFAKWAHGHAAYWQSLAPGLVVFGEWCGPGVEKGMAISQASAKLFAVFAIKQGDRVIHAPGELESLLPDRPADVHVLPWEGEPITIDFGSREALQAVARTLNDRVAEVEREDPWVKRTFGISGLGEGLVFYPMAGDPAVLMFKAKGDKHRTAGKHAVQVDASVAASVEDFVALVVTDARLEQGLATVCNGLRDSKQTGAFLAWVTADVRKEAVAELEASRLSWAQVEKAVQTRARKWFLGGGL
jgi:hypothetical protein